MNARDIDLAKPWAWIGAEGWTFNHEADLIKVADLIRADEREAIIEWIRNNYQDHNIASLCDAIRARENT